MTAYLVIREGSKWTDVFRLVEGESVTMGRAPTNAIVVKDERCSRNHAEVFQAQGQWTLRDLDSRNGTLVDGQRIQNDYHLQAGEIIRIGNSHLAFVNDLSQAFPDSHSVLRTAQAVDTPPGEDGTVGPPDNESVLETYEPTTITHRRGQSRFLEPPEEEDVDVSLPKVGRAAANLCRLAFELAKASDVITLANVALDGLFEGTQVDAGAVLLQARRPTPKPKADNLEVIASRSDSAHRYHRVSQFLSSTVMRDGQAVLARNVMDDSQLGSRDSKGEILATSVICAPIRRDGKVLGVIHLYATDAGKPTDPDDLEFTLAVADTVAVALENLSKQQELAENLNQIRDENVQLRERLGVQSEIIGTSEVMNQVTREIARAAPSRATVLIRGESGVGTELVARAVHFSSP
ncbi:MAG TPA: FHA domain-containing protein, partial [Lacipirellulaceae bacterium]|nr:FHA domain-containing protein [Lacipirellulaceae bacterium]